MRGEGSARWMVEREGKEVFEGGGGGREEGSVLSMIACFVSSAIYWLLVAGGARASESVRVQARHCPSDKTGQLCSNSSSTQIAVPYHIVSVPFTATVPTMQEDDFAATQRITDVAAVAGPSSSSSSKRIQEQQSSSSTSTSSGGGNAPSKLEPFLLLAKSARGAGAAALVDQVTAAPGVYVFAELLDAKAIAEVTGARNTVCSGGCIALIRACTHTHSHVALLSHPRAARQRRGASRSEVATPEPVCLREPAGLQE